MMGPTPGSQPNASQAKKLLVVGTEIGSAVGRVEKPLESNVVYVVPAESMGPMAETLTQLADELDGADVQHAAFFVLGISSRDDGIYLEAERTAVLPPCLQSVLDRPRRIVLADQFDDPIPLYLMPYDPHVSQDPKLEAYSKSVLEQRTLAEVMSKIGRQQVPARLTISLEEILISATSGAFLFWKDTAAANVVKQRTANFLKRRLTDAGAGVTASASISLDLSIQSVTERERLLAKLQRHRGSDEQIDIFEASP